MRPRYAPDSASDRLSGNAIGSPEGTEVRSSRLPRLPDGAHGGVGESRVSGFLSALRYRPRIGAVEQLVGGVFLGCDVGQVRKARVRPDAVQVGALKALGPGADKRRCDERVGVGFALLPKRFAPDVEVGVTLFAQTGSQTPLWRPHRVVAPARPDRACPSKAAKRGHFVGGFEPRAGSPNFSFDHAENVA